MAKQSKSRTLAHNRNKMSLDTLGGIRTEMGRLYRLVLNGKLRPDVATKLTFTLDKIRSCLEAEPPPEIYGPGAIVQVNVISIEAGRYITHQAIERLADGENIYNIAPGDLLEPVTIEHEPATAEVIPLRPANTDHTEIVEEATPATENVVKNELIADLIGDYAALSAKVENDGAREKPPDTA